MPDDPDLLEIPSIAKAERMGSPIELQVIDRLVHRGEIELRAIVEIVDRRRSKRHGHCTHLISTEHGSHAFDWSRSQTALNPGSQRELLRWPRAASPAASRSRRHTRRRKALRTRQPWPAPDAKAAMPPQSAPATR